MIAYEDLGRVNAPYLAGYERSFRAAAARGWFILGDDVRAFEAAFAAYCGVRHCVGVGSGLDALTLALRAFGFPAGSEVIVPSNTYIAVIFAVLHAGLTPVLVEPDPAAYTLDPQLCDDAVTPRTRALIPVHLYGRPCDMDPLAAVARRHGLRILEDCAQAHGAAYRGRKAGALGDCGAFSFYPTKNLGALGDGGAVVTDDDDLAAAVRRLRSYGGETKNVHEVPGWNSRLDEIQAGFLRVKLAHLDAINARKRSLAACYDLALRPPVVKPAPEPGGTAGVFHIYPVRHPRRDELKNYLAAKGIGSEIHYPVPPHLQPALAGMFGGPGAFPRSEEIHRTILSLPLSTFHTEADAAQVAAAVNAFS